MVCVAQEEQCVVTLFYVKLRIHALHCRSVRRSINHVNDVLWCSSTVVTAAADCHLHGSVAQHYALRYRTARVCRTNRRTHQNLAVPGASSANLSLLPACPTAAHHLRRTAVQPPTHVSVRRVGSHGASHSSSEAQGVTGQAGRRLCQPSMHIAKPRSECFAFSQHRPTAGTQPPRPPCQLPRQ